VDKPHNLSQSMRTSTAVVCFEAHAVIAAADRRFNQTASTWQREVVAWQPPTATVEEGLQRLRGRVFRNYWHPFWA